MVENYLRQNPLSHIQDQEIHKETDFETNDHVLLINREDSKKFLLRGNSQELTFCQAVERTFGCGLPKKSNTAAGGSGFPRLLWLGPGEWLIVTGVFDGNRLDESSLETFSGQHVQLLDLSDAYAVIGITGTFAREVLAKGCSLDLHPRVFRSGNVARTILGRVQVIIHQVKDAPSYDVYVHRSIAEYLWDWLNDAGSEYGIRIISS